jgi:hypothetical protein
MMHTWLTINRGRVEPNELGVAEIIEEIRCALQSLAPAQLEGMAQAIDKGEYASVGEYVESGFMRMAESDNND